MVLQLRGVFGCNELFAPQENHCTIHRQYDQLPMTVMTNIFTSIRNHDWFWAGKPTCLPKIVPPCAIQNDCHKLNIISNGYNQNS
jgi:hypothetical protein